mgnify:FL=1
MRRWVVGLCVALLASGVACRRDGDRAAPADGTETGPAAARSILPAPGLSYNAREGRVLYLHYCLTCHGEEGHGDGFNAFSLDPRPRDLADPAFQASKSDDDLAAIIRSGGGVAGMSTGMPPYGRTLNERRIRNVVNYLRTLPGASD